MLHEGADRTPCSFIASKGSNKNIGKFASLPGGRDRGAFVKHPLVVGYGGDGFEFDARVNKNLLVLLFQMCSI